MGLTIKNKLYFDVYTSLKLFPYPRQFGEGSAAIWSSFCCIGIEINLVILLTWRSFDVRLSFNRQNLTITYNILMLYKIVTFIITILLKAHHYNDIML